MGHKHRGRECLTCVAMEKQKKWYSVRLYQTIIFIAAVLTLSYLAGFPQLANAFYKFSLMIWWAILLGLVLGGLIGRFIPEQYISGTLSRKKKRTVLFAVVLGFLMSACSHGILAISMELYKKGASVPAVIAFLLASPWANLPVTFLLIGFFGAKAFVLIISAIVIALITGWVYLQLEKRDWVEGPVKVKIPRKFSIRQDARGRLKGYTPKLSDIAGVARETWVLTKMTLWWILIGLFLAGVANSLVTPELFRVYLGPTLMGLLVTLVIATVIEVCSEGSAPLSFEIFRQTGAFGNAFTFLMAGVATDYTEIGLVYSNIGRRSALLLPVVTVPQVLVLGYLFNVLL